jgi:8-oxo-dGTP diphosphatase
MGRRVAVRVHLESDEGSPLVGKGRSRLLELVQRTGSISAAAREMGMSYRNAWGVLREVASAAGGPVVESERGGARGGRTRLTPLGRELLGEYSRAEEAIEEEARRGAYPHPRLTVDAVVARGGRVLLVRRGAPPHEGAWALPGGFVRRGETLEQAVVRELEEETGLAGRVVGIVGAYSRPDRDPRGHTVSVVYALEVPPVGRPRGGDDAAEASWHDLSRPPRLAFDHSEILDDFLRRGYLPTASIGGAGEGRGPRGRRRGRATARPRRS